jgi:hypothetical protein
LLLDDGVAGDGDDVAATGADDCILLSDGIMPANGKAGKPAVPPPRPMPSRAGLNGCMSICSCAAASNVPGGNRLLNGSNIDDDADDEIVGIELADDVVVVGFVVVEDEVDFDDSTELIRVLNLSGSFIYKNETEFQ